MNKISIQGFDIDVNHFDTQISKNGRPFRLSGVSLVLDKPAVWIDKRLTHGTEYIFRYLDSEGGFFSFEFDPHNKFICKHSK